MLATWEHLLIMEGHYLYSLANFYVATWIITTIFCITAKDDDDFIKGVFLGFLFLANQLNWSWTDPGNMFIYHTALVLLMLFALQNVSHWKSFLIITYIMFLSDAFWMSLPKVAPDPETWNFPHAIFYWQSILNISLFVLCLITMKGCRDTLLARKLEKRKQDLQGIDEHIDAGEESIGLGGKAAL